MMHGAQVDEPLEEPVETDRGKAQPAYESNASITLIHPKTGIVRVKGEEYQRYYRYGATFKGEEGGTLVFYEDSAVIYGLDRSEHKACYIHIGYASPGAQTYFDGQKIDRTFVVMETPATLQGEEWPCIRIVGENSRLTCTFEKNGFISMDFLWPVPDTFHIGSVFLLGSPVRYSGVLPAKESRGEEEETAGEGAGEEKGEAKEKVRAARNAVPSFTRKLSGSNELTIHNPNAFFVTVSLRSGDRGLDVEVSPQDIAKLNVPAGKYDLYFVYSHQPRALYRGKSLLVNKSRTSIEVLRTADGQYEVK